MRGIYTSVNDIRRQVFAEVARLAYEGGDYAKFEEVPFTIIPGEIASYRDSVFLERAIVGERLRLTMGLPIRKANEHAPISEGLQEAMKPEKYYEPPLVNIIKFACHSCPDNKVFVTDACQGCLAHPCKEVCPKNAIEIIGGRSVIDQEKCIKCGKCIQECPYGAITKMERPCAKACGMDAIRSDEYGRAEIDYDKCVSCGMCLVNCPFGAIADKSQIFQTIQAIKSDVPVYAIVAPAVSGQFGPKLTPDKMKAAFRELGFKDIFEVAVGADLCTIQEAKEFIKDVPEKQPFMATSCCPAWSMMAKKLFPQFAPYISMALTPMVLTARLIKKRYPECKIAFIGPCAAKKLEASRRTIRSDVDFVLTFEEVMGMFTAKDIDFDALPSEPFFTEASGDGKGFAVSGGVAAAVVNCIKKLEPGREVKVQSAEGLRECRKMLTMAKAGKLNGYLLEGMACPGGCIAGAGTQQPINRSKTAVMRDKKDAKFQNVLGSGYKEHLSELEEA